MKDLFRKYVTRSEMVIPELYVVNTPILEHVFGNQINIYGRSFPKVCNTCSGIVIMKLYIVNTPLSRTGILKSNKNNYGRPFSKACNTCSEMVILELYVVNIRLSGTCIAESNKIVITDNFVHTQVLGHARSNGQQIE